MLRIRPWRPSDLGWIRQTAAAEAWNHLTDLERAASTPQEAAAGGRQMVDELLGGQNGAALVADVNGKPAGYVLIALVPHPTTGHVDGHLLDIWVSPHHRKLGIASQLTLAAEAFLARMGISQVKLYTSSTNEASRASAARCGYQVTGLIWSKAAAAQPQPSARPAGEVRRG